MPLTPGTRLGPYEVVACLGAGGMGEVYRARDTRLGREVAIKVLPEEFFEDEERKRRFEREAKLLAAVNHANIAVIHSFEEISGRYLLVQELLEGETLRERLSKGALAQHSAVEIGVQIAHGLAAAHAKGIVHRDVKPANVFVTSDGVVKLLDFGLAKLVQPELAVTPDGTTVDREPRTDGGTVLGTMGYTSPQQLRGEAADARSDIFSFGCVLYEMLSGNSPFLRLTGAETITAIMSEDPAPLAGTGRGIEALKEIVKRCLEREPGERFSSAHDLALALRAFSGGSDTPLTEPVAPGVRRRQRAVTVSLFALVFFAALFAGWRLVSWSRRPQQEASTKSPARIIVLPFENLGEPEDGYFAAGVTDEITSRLAGVRTLAVISRTTATQYDRKGKTVEQIGKDLGVGYVLEGSVRWDKSGGGHGRVRVTPQLVRVADDTHLWADRYDRQLADIFAIQGEVADGVVKALNLTLAPVESSALRKVPTRDLEAYDLYLRALALERRAWGPQSIGPEIELTTKAVARDPRFAEALALLAMQRIYLHFSYTGRDASELERARIEAERAVALSPNSAETHIALGLFHYQGRADYEAALDQFRKAMDLRPNDAFARYWVGMVRRRQGRTSDAEAELVRAVESDPQNARLLADLGETQLLLRKYADAIRTFEASHRYEETDYPDAYKAWAYVQWTGDTAAATRELKRSTWGTSGGAPYGSEEFILVRTALVARDWPGALRAIDGSRLEVVSMELQFQYVPLPLLRAEVLFCMRRPDAATESYEEARRILAASIAAAPDDERLHSALGLALAGLGRADEAIREGERGVELMPSSRDQYKWTYRAEDLARIHTILGDPGAAVRQLDLLLSQPSMLSATLLRLDPRWDPLRKSLKFQALLKKYEVKP
jgi:serine/threonine protein kinase/tetratricopeptide (TPR) repeat protein